MEHKPFCSTCGKDVDGVLCPTCAKWWADNPPPEEDEHPTAEDWRNRVERAEQALAEALAEVQDLMAELAYHGIYPKPIIADETDNTGEESD